ncbi:unnamed protein product [Ectocarpus sp. 6 AP-2014]
MVHAEQTNACVMIVLSITLAGSGSALSGSLSRILFHENSLGLALSGMEHPSHGLHSPLQTPRTAQQAPRHKATGVPHSDRRKIRGCCHSCTWLVDDDLCCGHVVHPP